MVTMRLATAISAVAAVASAGFGADLARDSHGGFVPPPAGGWPSGQQQGAPSPPSGSWGPPSGSEPSEWATFSHGWAPSAQASQPAAPVSVSVASVSAPAASPSAPAAAVSQPIAAVSQPAASASASAPAASASAASNYWNGGEPSVASWGQRMGQGSTNGNSTWGTMENPTIGPWVNGPMPQGSPWAARTAGNCNQLNSTQTPNTGVTRKYDFTVTDALLAPDGKQKNMIVINGQYPGPLIEANWGDWIEVTVNNNRSEGTSLHWHGFLQTGTPFMDGTPGISQCPVAPGSTFTYRFRAELYGTSWYHSHYSAQYVDGMVGPIVVHGPATTPYDIDLGPIMVSDWFHGYYEDMVAQIQLASPFAPPGPPFASNVLINGKANFDCNTPIKNYIDSPSDGTCIDNAGLSMFKLQSGKKHLMRFINSGAEGVLFVSIDNHEMEVVAQDFVPLVPYNTTHLILGVGQRNDVIFYADGAPTDSLWLRVVSGPPGEIPGGGIQPLGTGGCNTNTGYNNFTTAALYYEAADTSIPPNTTSDIPIEPTYITPFSCQNDPLNVTVPFFPIPLADADLNLDVIITGANNATGQFVWWMNNVTYLGDFNDPLLLEAKMGQTVFDTFRAMNDWSNYTSVRINLTGVGLPALHPMHVHGHNMQILSSGLGYWDGTIENPENPTRRDTWSLPPLGYAVMQWDLNNPGVWPFHCHIAWHTSEGMILNFIEGSVADEVELPYIMEQTCRDWSAWTGHDVVNILDSGL